MSLTVLLVDEQSRAGRLAPLLAAQGCSVTLYTEGDLPPRGRPGRAHVAFVGAQAPQAAAAREAARRSGVPVVELDSEPPRGENLCLDRAPEAAWSGLLGAAVGRYGRLARLRTQSNQVAARAAELYRHNRQFAAVNGRLTQLTATVRRMLLCGEEEERLLGEILAYVGRYNGGRPSVWCAGRKAGVAPRLGLGVNADVLAEPPVNCEQAAWRGLRPFDGYIAEYELESRLERLLGTKEFFYLPVGPQGRAHSFIAAAGSAAQADRAALRALLPFADRVMRHARVRRNLRVAAERDALTGLANHATLQRSLRLELKRHERIGRPLCVVMLDLDHFKAVNDAHGHPAGDQVLKAVAAALRRASRETDVVARYGGEEFTLVLPDTQRAGAERKVAEVLDTVRRLPLGSVGTVTLSAGIAAYPDDGATPTALLGAADRALYAAKDTGRDRAVTYAEWLERAPDDGEGRGGSVH